MTSQKRIRARLKFTAHVLIKSSGRQAFRGVLRDVSIESMYVICTPFLDIGNKANVEIILLGKNSELIIKAVAKVIRKDERGLALKFPQPLEWWPVFSQFTLHNLDNIEIAS